MEPAVFLNSSSWSWATIFYGAQQVAQLALVVVPFLALNTWARQQRGTTRFQLAGRVLRLATKMRREIKYTRFQVLNSDESAEWKPPDPRETQKVEQVMRERFGYEERIKHLFTFQPEIELVEQEVEAYLGVKEATLVRKLDGLIRELWGASLSYFGARLERARDKGGMEQVEQKTLKIIFGSVDESDEFHNKVESVISEIKGTFQRFLR